MTKTLTFTKAKESFFLAVQVEGRSKRTLDLYEVALKAFESYFVNRNPVEATPMEIRKYLLHLQDKGYAKATVYTHQKELRVFYNFLASEELIEKNPMNGIKQLRIPKIYPYVLSEEDIDKLLVAAKGKRYESKRNLAILKMFLDTGLRVSELSDLVLDDIDFTTMSIKVVGKGHKERTVFFGRTTAKSLKSYIVVRGNIPFEDRIFVTRQGGCLDRLVILKIVNRIGKRAGLHDKRVCPHTLRHTFATLYIKRGGSPFVLQRLLGHSDIKTVMVYVNLVGKDLREDYFRHSPLDSIK